MSAPLVRVAGLRKDFGSRRLLDIAHLEIEAGGAYVLTGANGSGKTTLMRILAGLEPADVQAFEFGGAPVALEPYPDSLRRAIVYVHQQPYLFHTSLRHNLEYGLKCRRVPATERARRIAETIAWAGLDARVRTPPQKMSGGEQQRAALARARVFEPELLMLDEPTASLDREGRAQTLALLARLRVERHAVVVACHDQEVIGLEGFRRLHLEDGGIA